jgi:hypothetical protein
MARIALSAGIVAFVTLALAAGTPRAAAAQVEVDRTLSRVGAAVITASDVDQARRVRLVRDTSSDAATLRALEDRLLILQEVGRGAQTEVSDDAVAARRRELAPDAAKISGLSEQALTAWCRDDVRVQMFMERRFASMSGADRDKAISEWIGRLRQRAGLRTP